MIKHPELLLYTGGAGWFLFTYLLALGKRDPFLTLIKVVFCWLIMVDPIAIIWGIALPALLHHPVPVSPLLFYFVAPPYILSVLRIYWLRRHPRPDVITDAKPRTPWIMLGVLLILTGAVIMSCGAPATNEPRSFAGIPGSVVGALAILAGVVACCSAIVRKRKHASSAAAR